MNGGSEDDYIDGGPGDDVMDGQGDDDVIEIAGGDSRDGDDLVFGGTGADLMQGADGFDTVSYDDHPASVTASIGGLTEGNGSDGAGDTISLAGLEKLVGTDDPDDGDVLGPAAIADNVFDGGAGPDDIDGGDGVDTVTYEGRDEPVGVSFLGGGGSTNQGGPLDGPVNARDQYTSIFKNRHPGAMAPTI